MKEIFMLKILSDYGLSYEINDNIKKNNGL